MFIFSHCLSNGDCQQEVWICKVSTVTAARYSAYVVCVSAPLLLILEMMLSSNTESHTKEHKSWKCGLGK